MVGSTRPTQAGALRKADARSGRALARALGLVEPSHEWERDRFRRRLACLVIEAYERGGIDRARAEAYLTQGAGLKPGEIAELMA